MLLRLTAIFMLTVAAAPSIALSQSPSPMMIACHDEATKRYIADFRQIGLPKNDRADDARVIVTSFVNDRSRYDVHYAECVARWNSRKAP